MTKDYPSIEVRWLEVKESIEDQPQDVKADLIEKWHIFGYLYFSRQGLYQKSLFHFYLSTMFPCKSFQEKWDKYMQLLILGYRTNSQEVFLECLTYFLSNWFSASAAERDRIESLLLEHLELRGASFIPRPIRRKILMIFDCENSAWDNLAMVSGSELAAFVNKRRGVE